MKMSYYSENQKDTLRAVGERIRDLREKKGATQDELASYMGTQRSTVAKWENGAQDFKSEAINKLARYFDCSIDYLLRGASAKTYDIYSTTGLVDSSVEMLRDNKSVDDDFFGGDIGTIDLVNELLSDSECFTLLRSFISIRADWRDVQSQIAEYKQTCKAAEPRSVERRDANEAIKELQEQAEFLLWKYEHSVDAYIHKLLEKK
jgi:transcriptional regulator with XRE-family HTH domain